MAMAHWMPTDVNQNSDTKFLSQSGVAGYEFPSDHTKHVIFQDNAKQIHEFYCVSGDSNWQHTNLTYDARGAPGIEQTTLTAYLDSGDFSGNNQYQHVVYGARSGDGPGLWEIYWQSGDKNFTNLTNSIPDNVQKKMQTLSAPEGYFNFGPQSIFFLLNESDVCQFGRGDEYGTGYWGFTNVIENADVILPFNPAWTNAGVFGPAAFLTGPGSSTTNVVYTPFPSLDSPIILLQSQNWIEWTAQSLWNGNPFEQANGPPIGGAITPTLPGALGLTAVHYCGQDGNLRQIHWFGLDPSQSIVENYNLNDVAKPVGGGTARPPQVLPLSRPNSYVFPKDQSTHVIYHGVDGHLHELTSTNGLDWTWLDMSADAGLTDDQAPLGIVSGGVIAHKAAFVFTEELTEHVAFTSVNNHVIELKRSM